MLHAPRPRLYAHSLYAVQPLDRRAAAHGRVSRPCVPVASRRSAGRSTWRARMPQHAKSILVVEDDAETREVLSAVLRFEGYQVLSAADGKQALDLLHHSALPHLILLDLMMPNMDGW